MTTDRVGKPWQLLLAALLGALLAAGAPDSRAQLPTDSGSAVLDAAQQRMRDAETLRALVDEGRVLYARERIKLDGAHYCGQAVMLAERGEFRQSIQAASIALMLGQQQDDAGLVASAKRDLAITYSYAGELDRAEMYAHDALAAVRGVHPLVTGPVLKVLGDIAMRRSRPADAIGFYRQADVAASDKYRPLVLISLANAYLADDQTAQARALYGRIGAPPAALEHAFKRGLANLHLAEGDIKQAMVLFAQVVSSAAGADAAYHRLWGQEGLGRARLLQNDRAGARRAYTDAARSAETMRSRFRSEEFKAGLFGDVQRIFDSAITLAVADGDFDGAWTMSEQSRSRALLDLVRDRVGAVPSPEPATLTQARVRAALRPGEAIIQFHVLDDELVAWVLRPAGSSGHLIARTRRDLAADVEAFRQSVLARSPSATGLAGRLHSLLLAPLQLVPGEQLLIVPHDALHYLPFQALRADDAWLIERHALAFAPSTGLAIALATRAADERGTLVAFGNPGIDARLALPNAESEVRTIGALFPDHRIFVKSAASRRAFRAAAIGGASILHIAAHAEVDVVDPLQSRILLAPDGDDPGFLDAREVYAMNFGAVSLVTLSACESGLGRIARGDEIMGFTRAFFSAGASTLLVSLWPVADDSTELLMTTLYRELARGQPALLAMQTGQLAVLRQPRFAHPYFWAPFDLMGNWRMRLVAAKTL